MSGFFRRRLQLQLLLILLAAVSVAALSVLLIWDSIQNAEKAVLADMGKQLNAALSELGQQYSDRITSDSTWSSLPAPTQDVSLRAVSQTVLRSYPGVEGGYYVRSQFLGYSFPTHDNPAAKTDVPSAERSAIQEVADRAACVHREHAAEDFPQPAAGTQLPQDRHRGRRPHGLRPLLF